MRGILRTNGQVGIIFEVPLKTILVSTTQGAIDHGSDPSYCLQCTRTCKVDCQS